MHEESLYDDIALAYDAWAGQLLADSVLDETTVIQPGEQVCAVACGAGRDARYLAYGGARVTGVDL